jgi:tyrosinase
MQTTSDDDNGVYADLDNNRDQLSARLFNLFSNYDNYMNVSNEAWIQVQDPSKYDSFESVHDLIHVLVGGGNNGNMEIINISAFDPAFWLHHA